MRKDSQFLRKWGAATLTLWVFVAFIPPASGHGGASTPWTK